MVQLEYRVQETFASATALLAWAHEHEENNIPQYTEVLQHFIPNSNGRGLLRLVSGPRANSMLYRRIRGKGHQAALVDQGVQSGDSDEPAPKRRATTQDDKPSVSHSFQLLFGRSVQEKPFAVPQLPSTNLQEVSSGGGNEPNRQPRLHRSSCTSAACYHCPPECGDHPRAQIPYLKSFGSSIIFCPAHCAMQCPIPGYCSINRKCLKCDRGASQCTCRWNPEPESSNSSAPTGALLALMTQPQETRTAFAEKPSKHDRFMEMRRKKIKKEQQEERVSSIDRIKMKGNKRLYDGDDDDDLFE